MWVYVPWQRGLSQGEAHLAALNVPIVELPRGLPYFLLQVFTVDVRRRQTSGMLVAGVSWNFVFVFVFFAVALFLLVRR